MTLCSDGHDEVCYEGRDCPACELKDQLAESQSKIESLQQWEDERVEE